MKSIKDFVAIDFETLQEYADDGHKYDHLPIEIGMTKVEDGEITDTFHTLINPPVERDWKPNFKVKISCKDCKNAPSWDTIHEDVCRFIGNLPIVAYNGSTERTTFVDIQDYYHIVFPFSTAKGSIIDPYVDCLKHYDYPTNKPKSKSGLKHWCDTFKLPTKTLKAHNALDDSKMCAILYLYIQGIDIESELFSIKTAGMLPFDNEEPETSICKTEDFGIADPKNPFYQRKVVITGFPTEEKKRLKLLLKQKYNAEPTETVSKNIHYLITGINPGPRKMKDWETLDFNGFHIMRLGERDLENIFGGKWDGYYTPEKIPKQLDFSMRHYAKLKVDFNEKPNPIAGKELYYGEGLAGDRGLFGQITGNLGAAGDNSICPETNILLLSDSTLHKLECGEKDETILYIENFYNNSKAVTFDYKFISEGDVLSFCKTWCEWHGDRSTSYYYNRYMETVMK